MQLPSVRCRAIIGAAAGFLLLALILVITTSLGAAPTLKGLPGDAVRAIAVHPLAPKTLVAATSAGLFRSLDQGETWHALAQPGGPGRISQLLFAPDGSALLAAGPWGLGVSADEGTSWRLTKALEGVKILALAVSPADGSLYAACSEQAWHSPDQGQTWVGLAAPEGAGAILSLAAHPASAGVLYLGAAAGLYVSGDRGATWYPVLPGALQGEITWVGFGGSGPARQLYAAGADALWRSEDDGATWQRIALPGQLAAQMEPIPWSVAPLMAGEMAGLPPLAPGEQLLSAALAPDDAPRLYLGSSLTLYASADGGLSWCDLGSLAPASGLAGAPLQETLAALPPYLAGVGLLLGLLGAGILWGERREARRQGLGLAAENNAPWNDIIADALLRHQRVTPDLLERIPQQARLHAMIRYVDSHRHQALIFQDDPPLILPTRGDRLRLFANTWSGLIQALDDREAAAAAASHLIEQLCSLLGFEPVERRIYRSLAGYMVEAPTLRLSLPARFPVIVLLKDTLEREDVRDLRALMSALNAVSFFALLIPLSEPFEGPRPAQTMQSLAREGAEDLIVLDYRELYGLYLAADAESDLVRRILDQVDLTVVSPYVLSGPVPPRMFFGRDYEIKVIMRTVQDRSFAIVGGRKIGKTSILNKVHRLLQQTEGYDPLYLDCHHVTTYEDFFEALSVMSEVSVESPAPDSLRRIVVRLRGRQGELGHTLVFLLDEVDHLLRYDLQQGTLLFRVFRSLSQEGLCRFVFCGERTLDAALRDPNSPLFNFCSTLRLGYLQQRDAERIVQEPMHEMGITFEAPELVPPEIVALSGCHPNIVQAICQLLIERINQRQERVIRASDLVQVRDSTEFRDLFFEVSWGNATTLERLITVLMAEHRRFGLQQVRQALRELEINPSDAELERALGDLALTSLIKRQGQQYEYTSGAFARVLEEAGLAEGLREGLLEKLREEQKDHSATPSQK